MAVIGQHCVSAHVNGKYFDQLEDAGEDPDSPMGEIPPGMQTDPTQEPSLYAAGGDVAVGRGVQRNELAAGHWHGGLTELWFEIQDSGRCAPGL